MPGKFWRRLNASRRAISKNGIRSGLRLVSGCRQLPSSAPPQAIEGAAIQRPGRYPQIQCPLFIADPDDEQFWPGQSQEVYDALVCPKTLVRFTAEEGANWHCEPKARALYDQRLFDWLATAMPK
jgi:hypothetical protein